jgi:hypothetical protein
MLTYSKIGHFGRLGNQLFQMISTIGIAKKLGYEAKFPVENITESVTENFKDGKVLNITFDVPKVFNIDDNLLASKEDIKTTNTVSEQCFHFDERMFSISDSSDLLGYYQSDKYFKHIEQDIRNLLTFKSEIQQTANKLIPRVDGSLISIHIRRGDYVHLQQFHPTCTPEYYLEAAFLFAHDNPYYVIFSDDIDYCKSLFVESENILYINNIDPYVDLCLMSMCQHNIIANSSFSWWGAWLNKNTNKKVIAPKQWFGPAYTHNTKDLYCDNWIIL